VPPVLTSLGEWALSCSGEAHDRDCQVVQADCSTRRLRFYSLQQSNLAAVDCAARFSRSRSWRLFARQRRWSGFSSYSQSSLFPGKQRGAGFGIISVRTGARSSYNDWTRDRETIGVADGQQSARSGSLFFDSYRYGVADICSAAAARLFASAAGRDVDTAGTSQHAAADLIQIREVRPA
jgi:hypothetical protein